MPIEQIRTFLAITLLVVLFLLWQAWQQDYGITFSRTAPGDSTGQTGSSDWPGASPSSQPNPDIPLPPGNTPSTGDRMIPALPSDSSAPEAGVSSTREKSPYIHVRTDVLDLQIEPARTGIHQLKLLEYPESEDEPGVPVQLLSASRFEYFIAEAPLFGSDSALHKTPEFHPEQNEYHLAEGRDTLRIRLPWSSGDGIGIVKTITFRRGSYLMEVSHEITNAKKKPLAIRLHGRLTRYPPPDQGSFLRLPTYTGGVISNAADPYEKIDFSEMDKQDLDQAAKGGWIAMIQHYFIGSWIPEKETMNRYYTSEKNSLYTIGVSTDKTIASGGNGTVALRAYLGPKIQDRMEAAAPNLARTVDYGWLWFISQPLFWLLGKIYLLVGNWGVAIIVLTLLIKLVFFHLSATSYRSMARMRKLQPRMMKLRDTYKNDKAKMNQRLMELYKEEKVNPVSGCLPILVQIPVFIALYWVLLESVELRQTGFLWLTDLSVYDPFFILPLTMGASMFLQQKLNPTPPDPVQAKVMMALPFVFTGLFLFFPSGLVLYWVVNNGLSILQQWAITRQIAPNT